MTRTRFLRIAVALLVLTTLLSCSFIPDAITGIFATKTPTATATPTVTPTPKLTVSFQPCPHREPCANAVPIFEFAKGDIQSGVEKRVLVQYDQPTSFLAGWIARDQTILEQNMYNIETFLEIDGQSVLTDAFVSTEPYYDPKDDQTYAAMWVGAVISGWKIGEPHRVRIGYRVLNAINDGWEIAPQGTRMEFIYLVNPADIPEPTATRTPRPTATPNPTKTPTPRNTPIPSSPTPSCPVNATITINNQTSGRMTIYLTGPAKFTFYVNTGTQTLNVCAGTYSYTGYGCGGDSINGTMKSGETHDFWCQ